MTRTLTKSEVDMAILRLIIAGFFPKQHFSLDINGQIYASPEARSFLKKNLAWIETHQHMTDS